MVHISEDVYEDIISHNLLQTSATKSCIMGVLPPSRTATPHHSRTSTSIFATEAMKNTTTITTTEIEVESPLSHKTPSPQIQQENLRQQSPPLSPFLSLPREIRDQVYSNLLGPFESIQLDHRRHSHYIVHHRRFPDLYSYIQPFLLNSQIHSEFTDILARQGGWFTVFLSEEDSDGVAGDKPVDMIVGGGLDGIPESLFSSLRRVHVLGDCQEHGDSITGAGETRREAGELTVRYLADRLRNVGNLQALEVILDLGKDQFEDERMKKVVQPLLELPGEKRISVHQAAHSDKQYFLPSREVIFNSFREERAFDV
ncbi:hypothetical protein K402DRAFT_389094 [Aulographum hederae CBS 113979]|uniref:F-box domain-containing protein n=1 Tax=Aulographum hederae CBS 113979 TaxID=1176131 RepID=A0A6G1HFK9_9PEZI|nr:hypothetical protein K402DRAFT_389094 [Aulographum hederae CBS 113979]